jgi:hypothetical protein
MAEWADTKLLWDRVLTGYEEEEEFDPVVGCLHTCQLPLRFGIPCRHWMYLSFSSSPKNEDDGDTHRQLPLSLFHPQWYLDGPSVVRDPWRITWESVRKPPPRVRMAHAQGSDSAEEEVEDEEEEERSRFARRGEEMVNHTARGVVKLLRTLPLGDAGNLAVALRDTAQELVTRQVVKTQRRQEAPSELPAALPKPNVRKFT